MYGTKILWISKPFPLADYTVCDNLFATLSSVVQQWSDCLYYCFFWFKIVSVKKSNKIIHFRLQSFLGFCEFRNHFSRWEVKSCSSVETESCPARDVSDCQYDLAPIQNQVPNFGAEIHGLELKTLSQPCAIKLIQDAMMHRFLVFPGQTSMTWQDQIRFTELMGEGNAFPETNSPNRKVTYLIKSETIIF